MESRPVVPDRKLLARLVLIREEARNMIGGGILDERNDRGLDTLPESEVCFLDIRFQAKLTTLTNPAKGDEPTADEGSASPVIAADEGSASPAIADDQFAHHR
nr:uncharacterized protein LOC109173744 [Ipomoea trifida]